MDEQLLAGRVDELYGVDPSEFVAERKRLVASLRADGHRDEARQLASCRKPTVPAAAVNRLVRTHPDEVAQLVAAADRLRDRQRRAAAGRGSQGLREAGQQVRELAAALRDLAAQAMAADGRRPDAHLAEVEQTLFAAATDPDRQELLRRGVLTTALQASGFGGLEGMLVAVPDAEPDTEDDQAPDDDEERARAEARQREQERGELADRRAQLMRERDRQQGRVDRAQQRLDDLVARMEAARAEVDEHGAELDRLDEELQAVAARLKDLDTDA